MGTYPGKVRFDYRDLCCDCRDCRCGGSLFHIPVRQKTTIKASETSERKTQQKCFTQKIIKRNACSAVACLFKKQYPHDSRFIAIINSNIIFIVCGGSP